MRFLPSWHWPLNLGQRLLGWRSPCIGLILSLSSIRVPYQCNFVSTYPHDQNVLWSWSLCGVWNSGLASNIFISAYLTLPLQFFKPFLKAPAVVLKNKSYNLLIVTQFIMEFKGIINHHESFLSLLGYQALLAQAHVTVEKDLKKWHIFLLEYPKNIMSL